MLKKFLRTAIWALFIAYCPIMIGLLFFLQRSQRAYAGFNFVPLRTITQYFKLLKSGYFPVRTAVINLAGNIVMFVPLGLFLPAIWKGLRRFRSFAVTVAAAIIAVELLQFLFRLGSCDIDDLILNVFYRVQTFTVTIWAPRRLSNRQGLLVFACIHIDASRFDVYNSHVDVFRFEVSI